MSNEIKLINMDFLYCTVKLVRNLQNIKPLQNSLTFHIVYLSCGLTHIKEIHQIIRTPGLELIKLELILKLKIKCNDRQAIIVLYFEFKNELKFYNL